MNVLLPSEVARLVLGYLSGVKCDGTRLKFLEECPHLREYAFLLESGQEYPTTIFGRDLIHYLNLGYQYTQYITTGDPLKYPLPNINPTFASASQFHSFYLNRSTSLGFPANPVNVSDVAQPPRPQSQRNAAGRLTPRLWSGASPADTRGGRSPAESELIDVTTVTEPPSEPNIPPNRSQRMSETGIQTDLPQNEDSMPAPLATSSEIAAPMPIDSSIRLPRLPSPVRPTNPSMESFSSTPKEASKAHGANLPVISQTDRFVPVTSSCVIIDASMQPCSSKPAFANPACNVTPSGDKDVSTPSVQSPRRKPMAPKRRSVPTFDMVVPGSPVAPVMTDSRKSFEEAMNEFLQCQLAERLADSINEARKDSVEPQNVSVKTRRSHVRTEEAENPSTGSNLPDNVLCDVISKTLSDPIMEELAEYMALQKNSCGLATPEVSPIKCLLQLKTPFKQIATDVESEGCYDSPASMVIDEGPCVRGSAIKIKQELSATKSCTLKPGESVVVEPGNAQIVSVSKESSITITSTEQESIVSRRSNNLLAESMKIIVNSSPAPVMAKPPVYRGAPRKPSPKVSPPTDTSSTIDTNGTTDLPPSTVLPRVTTKSLPGTHIRQLDFNCVSDRSNNQPKINFRKKSARSLSKMTETNDSAEIIPPKKRKPRTSAVEADAKKPCSKRPRRSKEEQRPVIQVEVPNFTPVTENTPAYEPCHALPPSVQITDSSAAIMTLFAASESHSLQVPATDQTSKCNDANNNNEAEMMVPLTPSLATVCTFDDLPAAPTFTNVLQNGAEQNHTNHLSAEDAKIKEADKVESKPEKRDLKKTTPPVNLLRKSAERVAKPPQRKAILVDVIPHSRRTAPTKVSSRSKARPPIQQPAPKVPTIADKLEQSFHGLSEFRLPSTPVKVAEVLPVIPKQPVPMTATKTPRTSRKGTTGTITKSASKATDLVSKVSPNVAINKLDISKLLDKIYSSSHASNGSSSSLR